MVFNTLGAAVVKMEYSEILVEEAFFYSINVHIFTSHVIIQHFLQYFKHE